MSHQLLVVAVAYYPTPSNPLSPSLLHSALILTHCHADHDAGTFQKILQERKVTVLTTPTIMSQVCCVGIARFDEL